MRIQNATHNQLFLTAVLNLTRLKHFIGMRYGSSISTCQICEDFDIPVDDRNVWFALFSAIVYTLLSGLAVLLLHRYFRWCECRVGVPSVCYFNRTFWKQLKSKALVDFQSNLTSVRTCHRSSPHCDVNLFDSAMPAGISTVPAGCSHLFYLVAPSPARLALKRNRESFRLVINASCRHWPSNSDDNLSIPCKIISVNQRLRYANGLAEFLCRLRSELPAVFLPSMPSVNMAFKTLLVFRSTAYAAKQTQFWLAKLDILNCFHSIDHDRLLQVFEEACTVASKYICPLPDTVYLKRELAWFLKQSVILLDGKQFVFTRGIPQGSCVCSDLADLYLAHADRALHDAVRVWSPKQMRYKTEPLVVRYLDDYLCVSADRENLAYVVELLKKNSRQYGLRFNDEKAQSNLVHIDSSVMWLGMTIQNDLSIILPETEQPIFCRYAGLPLSANECLMRLYRTRLDQINWRFAFSKMPTVFGDPCSKTPVRFRGLVTLNTVRLGFRLADLFWIAIKSSPQRARLLRPDMCKRLAGIVKCELYSLLGPRQWRLQRLALNSFIRRLHSHRGELVQLFHALQNHSHPQR
ncbi:hypothetical protein FGIG_07584 [Fasciola gigantica]|uniref:Telomerase reverse transcriptase n=1 Tax=Fasciola gigantica TaxID=46835 RepID=A0A504Y6W3_FASGI|nr:hypothetical protein FGIG_07584 [Fasciola gigantica]